MALRTIQALDRRLKKGIRENSRVMVYIYTLILYYLWMVNKAGLNVSVVCLTLNFFW